MHSTITTFIAFASAASAHFILQTPPTIGFADETLTDGPCGGFEPTDRSGGVTDWPVNGYPFSAITTHLDVVWTFKAALVSDTSNWVPIYADVHQTGVPEFCIPRIPGVAAWIGQPAVVQIVQQAPDGFLYQCAAVRFVSGGPASPGGDCRNSTGVEATAVPGTGPQPTEAPSPSSSSSSSSSSRTTTLPPTGEPEPPSTTLATSTTSSSNNAGEPEAPTTTDATRPGEPTEEPTEEPEPTSDSSTTHDHGAQPTGTYGAEPTHDHTEAYPTATHGGHDHSTMEPEYPTLAPNTTQEQPTAPPAYTGGANAQKGISVAAVLLVGIVWVL